MKKHVVVSGINLYEGGTLRIFHNFCDEIIESKMTNEYIFTLFVHKKELFAKYESHFDIIELPDSRTSWFKRIYYEYIWFNKFSKDKDIYLWISIHDSSPRVHAQHQISYFHNPTFDYKATLKDWKYEKKMILFSLLYKYVYKFNVHANDFIIVQQDWIAKAMSKLLPFDINKIIVMRPEQKSAFKQADISKKTKPYTFFFPAISRHFKNFEVILEAMELINKKEDSSQYQVILTIDGSENKYAKDIIEKYKNIPNVKFIGTLNQDEVFKFYETSSCLIFPSTLETWGLPISEAKQYHLPLIVSDLPYAHETVGTYDKVIYFQPNNPKQLAQLMTKAFKNENIFTSVTYTNTSPNICTSWKEVFEEIKKG